MSKSVKKKKNWGCKIVKKKLPTARSFLIIVIGIRRRSAVSRRQFCKHTQDIIIKNIKLKLNSALNSDLLSRNRLLLLCRARQQCHFHSTELHFK